MNGSGPEDRPAGNRSPAAPDEEYAQAYADGYGEGLREAFREILQHASRGHTAQELRFLIESRLARLKDEIELKRRSLLGPPRRGAIGPMFRGPAPPEPGRPEPESDRVEALERGQCYLYREVRPLRSVELVAGHSKEFPRVVAISHHPPEDPRLRDRWIVLRLALSAPSSGTPDAESLDLGAIGGRVREATAAPGGALVYLDAVEFFVTEYGLDPTFRFINFLVDQVGRTGSVLVVSTDPDALPPTDRSRLQRLFGAIR